MLLTRGLAVLDLLKEVIEYRGIRNEIRYGEVTVKEADLMFQGRV